MKAFELCICTFDVKTRCASGQRSNTIRCGDTREFNNDFNETGKNAILIIKSAKKKSQSKQKNYRFKLTSLLKIIFFSGF